jgi:hypothetical protein
MAAWHVSVDPCKVAGLEQKNAADDVADGDGVGVEHPVNAQITNMAAMARWQRCPIGQYYRLGSR